MNSALVHLTHGRSVTRIAMVIITVILGTALAAAPEALAFGGGRFAEAEGEDITLAAAGARILRQRRVWRWKRKPRQQLLSVQLPLLREFPISVCLPSLR